MKVKLISYSQSPQFPGRSESALDLIAYCARVSNPSNQNNKETSEKLVKYLMKHKHWSTTRNGIVHVLRLKQPETLLDKYCDTEVLVSKSSVNVMLIQQQDLSFEVRRQARLQDPKNRQNSIEADLLMGI